jgi:ferric-dicitrate binding protein FerR (iron transport regulator)
VSYPKTFTGANRTIEETGEVYLEVPKSSSSVVIKAKGIGNIICHSNTRINIMNYREDSCSRVVVVSGMATIDIGKNKDKVELREGEAYEMLGSVNGETIYIDGRQSISWMREIPVYYMLKLRVILNALQRNFRVKIDAKDKDILETTYTTSYEPGENVETVLKGLADIGHLSFEKNGMNGYEIRRKGK